MAARAVVPIRAVQALVANSLDAVVAAIANSIVSLATSGSQTARYLRLKSCALDRSNKRVLGVVTVSVSGKAGPAEIKVLARGAMDKFGLGKLLDTAVASANAGVQEVVEDRNNSITDVNVGGCRDSGSLFNGFGLGLGSDTLSGTVSDDSILDHPIMPQISYGSNRNTLIKRDGGN